MQWGTGVAIGDGVGRWTGCAQSASAFDRGHESKCRREPSDKIFEHDQELTAIALERLVDVPGIAIQGPTDMKDRGGVVSMTMDGVHAHDLATILDEQNVAVRAGHHCAKPLMRSLGVTATARASFYVYNEEADIDALVSGLRRAGEIFGVN